jgi:hypothetical protein
MAITLASSLIAAPDAAQASNSAASLIPSAGQYVPLAPVKVLDTTDGTGGVAVSPLASGNTVNVGVTGVGSIPTDSVAAVFVEITAMNPAASGCLQVSPGDASNPAVCEVSFTAGQNITNGDAVQVGDDGTINVTNSASGSVDVSVVVLGYFTGTSPLDGGDTYVGLAEGVVANTSTGWNTAKQQVAANSSLTVSVNGLNSIPSGADGAALYITAFNTSGTGTISIYPAGSSSSSALADSYVSGVPSTNLWLGQTSAAGQITLVNNGSSSVDIMVVSEGALIAPTATEAGASYLPVAQQRIVDTRYGTGVPQTPIAAGASVTFAATGVAGIPDTGVSAIAESVAALNAQSSGYLSVYAAGTSDPGRRTVNFVASGPQDNEASLALVSSTSPAGEETITNHSSGTVDVIVSARGYFTSATVPAAPVLVTSSYAGGNATIQWSAPSTDGGAAITGYILTFGQAATESVSGATTSVTVPTSGSDTVSVYAANTVGTGPASPAIPVNGGSTVAPPSSPGPLAVTTSSNGWITYGNLQASSLDITNQTTSIITGTVNSAGDCTISDSQEAAASSTSEYFEETAYNPTTCQAQVLTGGLSSTAESSLGLPADPTTQSADIDVSGSGSTTYQSAYSKSRWVDPLDITITSMTANLKWPLYGASGKVSGRNNPYEFKYDGWSNSGTPKVKVKSFNTSDHGPGWYSGAAETFTNTDFEEYLEAVLGPAAIAACDWNTAPAVFHLHDTVTGWQSDWRGWAYSDTKKGGCANLVHHSANNGWGWTS